MTEKLLTFESKKAERAWYLFQTARQIAASLPPDEGIKQIEVKLAKDARAVASQIGEVTIVNHHGRVKTFVPPKTVEVLNLMNIPVRVSR